VFFLICYLKVNFNFNFFFSFLIRSSNLNNVKMKIKFLATLALGSLLFASCTKSTDSKVEHASIRKLSLEEKDFLNQIKARLDHISIDQREIISPENLENEFEYLGLAISQTISEVNMLETTAPSLTASDYIERFETSFLSNSQNFNLIGSLEVDSEFFVEISNLLLVSSSKDDINLSILELKEWEVILKSTPFISELQKQSLICYATIMKYTKHAIYTNGLVVGTHEIFPNNRGFWDCFDSTFNRTAERNLGVLADTNSPVLMAGAWIGLPATLGYGVGDAIYHGVVDCW
jgi:hypothetical protein